MKRSPAPIRGYFSQRWFRKTLRDFKAKILLHGKFNSLGQAFCIVHWNAPDFLQLNVKQIEILHPESNIYVLDNGSEQSNLETVKKTLEQFDNATLIWAKPRIPVSNTNHTVALQFLLNYSALQSNNIAVFLDQDCILSNNIDCLTAKLNNNILLVGVRDYVVIPKEYGPLKRGSLLRKAPHLVHASFMIMQPDRIRRLFGDCSLFQPPEIREWQYEEYHGISNKSRGRIVFLETKMHNEIPLLTSYSHGRVTYAWHAWYSSRTTGLSDQSALDALPVSWLREVRKLAYEYMKQIHKEAIARRVCRSTNDAP